MVVMMVVAMVVTRSYVVQGNLTLSREPELILHSCSYCLCLQSVGNTGASHQLQLKAIHYHQFKLEIFISFF